MVQIDEPECLMSQYRQAKSPHNWINLNAITLGCTPWELGMWLKEHGQEVDMRGLKGCPRRKKEEKMDEANNTDETTKTTSKPKAGEIVLTRAEVSVIRQYADKYHEACAEGRDDEIMTAADRLATVLDVILTIAAARADT